MDNDQSRASNSSRESGSEFANSVTGSTRASAVDSVSDGKDSISGKDSITHSIAESEPAEAPRDEPAEAPTETTSEMQVEVTPDDITSVCATQACAQPTDIVKLAEATLQNLKVLWDEIGFAEHECDNATAEMFAEVKRVFENKLSTTQEVAPPPSCHAMRAIKCAINSTNIGHPYAMCIALLWHEQCVSAQIRVQL
eukprot:374823-Rhodomonas_salina.1